MLSQLRLFGRIPRGPLRVDWTNGLTAGLKAFWTFDATQGGFVDVAYRRTLTPTGNPTIVPSAAGPAVRCDGSTQYVASASDTFFDANDFVVLVGVTPRGSLVSFKPIISRWDENSNHRCWVIMPNSTTSQIRCDTSHTGADFQTVSTGSGILVLNKRIVLGYLSQGTAHGTNQPVQTAIWVDGVRQGQNTSTIGNAFTGVNNPVQLCHSPRLTAVNDVFGQYDIDFVAFWSRYLMPAQLASLTRDPGQVLISDEDPIASFVPFRPPAPVVPVSSPDLGTQPIALGLPSPPPWFRGDVPTVILAATKPPLSATWQAPRSPDPLSPPPWFVGVSPGLLTTEFPSRSVIGAAVVAPVPDPLFFPPWFVGTPPGIRIIEFPSRPTIGTTAVAPVPDPQFPTPWFTGAPSSLLNAPSPEMPMALGMGQGQHRTFPDPVISPPFIGGSNALFTTPPPLRGMRSEWLNQVIRDRYTWVKSSPKILLLSGPINISLSATLDTESFIRFSVIPTVEPFHDPIWVAVEVDVFNDTTPLTLRMGNRGVLKRVVSGTTYNYVPRLSDLPIFLGASINVTQYGSPVHSSPNAGVIKFAIDESIWPWFGYHWIGATFRVYEGVSVDPTIADVDTDLTLVYTGRVNNLTYETTTPQATIETTDAGLDLDKPLITDFYPVTAIDAIKGRPKPYLYGGPAFELEPQLLDEATQHYQVSARTGIAVPVIFEVTVGGIPWNPATYPPSQGEWAIPPTPDGTFYLGSPPLGMDVRCQAQHDTFAIGSLVAKIATDSGLVGAADLADLDVELPHPVSFYSGVDPINRKDVLDRITNDAACWWAINPAGEITAGTIEKPSTTKDYTLNTTNIESLALTTILPEAWRIRVGYRRNWNPITTFAASVLQAAQSQLSSTGVVYEPHYENNTALTNEPRAVDVPLIQGASSEAAAAKDAQTRLIAAWARNRTILEAKAKLRASGIKLYQTVEVDYMLAQGKCRVVSTVRAIGSRSASSTLQLWGNVSTPARPAPAPPVISGTAKFVYTPILNPVPAGSDAYIRVGYITAYYDGVNLGIIDTIFFENAATFPFYKFSGKDALGYNFSSYYLLNVVGPPIAPGESLAAGTYATGTISGSIAHPPPFGPNDEVTLENVVQDGFIITVA